MLEESLSRVASHLPADVGSACQRMDLIVIICFLFLKKCMHAFVSVCHVRVYAGACKDRIGC